MTSASIMSPAIHPYMSMRPHQPRPSVMRRKVPMRFSAACIPVVFLSSPSPARFSTSFSDSSEDEKACEDCLSACAMLRRELVRSSCSPRLWEKSFSVLLAVEESMLAELVKAVSAGLSTDLCLDRRLERVSVTSTDGNEGE